MELIARRNIFLLILSVLLCTWHVNGPDSMGECLDAFAALLPEPLQVAFIIAVFPLVLSFSLSFMMGTALIARLLRLRFGRATAGTSQFHPIVLPLVSMCWAAVQAVPFLRVPVGASIRPVGWAFIVSMVALVLTVRSIGGSIASLKRCAGVVGNLICILSVGLSFTVLVLPICSLGAVASIRGFTLAP